MIEEITAELDLLEKIINESESQEDRAEARSRMKKLKSRLLRAKMPRLSPECIKNPLHPSCPR